MRYFFGLLAFFLAIPSLAFLPLGDQAVDFTYSGKTYTAKFERETAVVTVTGQSQLLQCVLLDSKGQGKVKNMPHFWLNYEQTAFILADVEYLAIEDLMLCSKSTKVRTVPEGAGGIADINLKHGVYVALDIVSDRPSQYLATVAKIDSIKPLILLPGAYYSQQSINKLRRYAFTYSDQAKISPDGRYVAVNGSIDCQSAATVGVWDLLTKKRVILKPKSEKDDVVQRCQALFDKN